MDEVKAVPENKDKTPDLTAQALAQDTTKIVPNEAEQLRNQLKELETKVAEAQKEAMGHKRVASEKQRKIEELAQQVKGSEGYKGLRAEFAGLLEKVGGADGLNDPAILAQAKQMREAERREELVAYAEQRREQVRDEVEQIIKDANQNPKDEAFDNLWDRFKLDYFTDGEGGEFATVKERAKRIVNKMKPVETKPQKPKDQEFEDWYKERRRAELEKEGKLVSDTNIPSGASGSWLEFEQKYIKGEISEKDYETRARAEGKI